MYSPEKTLIRLIGLVGRLWFGLACVCIGVYQVIHGLGGIGWGLLLGGLFVLPKSTPWEATKVYDDVLLVVGCLIILGLVLY